MNTLVGRPWLFVLRALKLGDLVVAVPALRALRRAFPAHHLALACPPWLDQVVPLVGAVDELVPADGLQPLQLPVRPAVAVNLHGRGPQSYVLIDELRPLRRIGHSGHGWSGPPWREDIAERDRWCALLRAHGIAADPTDVLLAPPQVPSPAPRSAVVHPGAAFGCRRWPVERFAAVATELRAAGIDVVITGSAAEQGIARTLADRTGLPAGAMLAGRTDLASLAALVADARLVITGDTGVAHLSYAYRTPSVVLFGPVPASLWGPPPNGPHIALSVDHLRRGERFSDAPDPALLGVTVEDVTAAAWSLLDRTNVGTPGP